MLDCAGGLLMLLRTELDRLAPGQVLEVVSQEPTVWHDLPAWARVAGHALVAASHEEGGDRYLLRKGDVRPAAELPDWGRRRPSGSAFETPDMLAAGGRAGTVPEAADDLGFVPRGAVAEPGSPGFGFPIRQRSQVWADNIAELYEQATANQWDASHDIPWDTLPELPEPLERAVCQVMTFLVENEFSALYLPGKFIARIDPRYQETVMFLATQMMDEARHIEVFTKRALANGGGLQYSAASTQVSLQSLFEQGDFTMASFLLSVLGEGTFLDLLRFLEDHAPDPVTREIARRTRVDEARHVHFGMAHVRYYLEHEPGGVDALTAAVRERAAYMTSVTAVSPMLQQALAILAAGSLAPEALAMGVERMRRLMETMHENRVKRLAGTGFTAAQAEALSRLHTPNFM